jgi:hypothetical protein
MAQRVSPPSPRPCWLQFFEVWAQGLITSGGLVLIGFRIIAALEVYLDGTTTGSLAQPVTIP